MEIDLNLAVCDETEENACGEGGECDHFSVSSCISSYSSNAAACASSSTSSSSSSSSSLIVASSPSMYMELWHACAGPTILPKKGDLVVYFPQGHLEQANSTEALPSFDLPPQILCRVVDVQLIANKENDEVYTQLTLHPLPQMAGVKLEGKEKENVGVDEGGNGEAPAKSTSHMFCKTLTASDTSTHGGFSVPRRAAEDCFPPLNYEEQRPSQELVATDLHGVEWKFRHIYRGQPRRHLLTTGWSIFVNRKKLVSGDAVLFLRGEAGDLRLGIRRAARPKNGLPDPIIKNQNYYPNVLSHVANALSSNSMFNVVYSPRASYSGFVVPYQKYLQCTASRVPVGTRFIMKYGLDDAPERRFSGVVTGVSDADPYRWPNSKWRSLMVRWDDVIDHQERVSPWEIDSSCGYEPPSIHPFQGMKRLRSNLQASPNGSSFSRGGLVSDFEESVRSSKVLQGQENVGFVSSIHRSDRVNRGMEFELHPSVPITEPNRMENISNGEFVGNQAPATFTGFLESNRFPKVLQGQEICSFQSLAGRTGWDYGARLKSRRGCNVQKSSQFPAPSFYPLASEGVRNLSFPPHKDIFKDGHVPPMLSSFFNSRTRTGYPVLTTSSIQRWATADNGRALHSANESRALERTSAPETASMHLKNMISGNDLEKVPVCKLFGFSLTGDPSTPNAQGQSKRRCTKVHKQGSRAMNLSQMHGYDNLLSELERLFSIEEGPVRDPNHRGSTLYADSDNNVVVGSMAQVL